MRNGRRIKILSSYAIFGQALAELLRREGYVTEADAKIRAGNQADVIVVDLDHEAGDAMTTLRHVATHAPRSHVVAMGAPLRLAASRGGGESARLDTSRNDASGLVALLRGRQSRPANELTSLERVWARVTPRQRDVLRWLVAGLDNIEIARRLRVGERAIKAHVSSLLVLFGKPNRTALALLADRAGVRPPVSVH